MADLERERFEEDIPQRSQTVSEMASNPRPSSESVDRRHSLPGDISKKVEKHKVKPRLSEGGKWGLHHESTWNWMENLFN